MKPDQTENILKSDSIDPGDMRCRVDVGVQNFRDSCILIPTSDLEIEVSRNLPFKVFDAPERAMGATFFSANNRT